MEVTPDTPWKDKVMEFGVFYQLPCAPDQTPSGRYADLIAQSQLADELGFHNLWLAELHFYSRFSVMPAPLLVAAAIAQSTRNIKLGTAVNLVPLHHPIRLAEEVATLDVLSQGRAIFGIGRGSIARHYDGYGVAIEEGRQRFQEALDMVLKSWTEDELTYQGEFYQADQVQVVPKPIQQPHPPVYIAANSQDTFPIVGAGGHNVLVTPMIISAEGVKSGLASYRQTLSECGYDPGQVKITVNMPAYVAEDNKRARAGFEGTVNNYLGTLRDMGGASRGSNRANELTYDLIHDELAVIGDPDECVRKLKGFQETFGNQEFMFWFNIGGMLPHEEVARSMRLFASEVMPHLQ